MITAMLSRDASSSQPDRPCMHFYLTPAGGAVMASLMHVRRLAASSTTLLPSVIESNNLGAAVGTNCTVVRNTESSIARVADDDCPDELPKPTNH